MIGAQGIFEVKGSGPKGGAGFIVPALRLADASERQIRATDKARKCSRLRHRLQQAQGAGGIGGGVLRPAERELDIGSSRKKEGQKIGALVAGFHRGFRQGHRLFEQAQGGVRVAERSGVERPQGGQGREGDMSRWKVAPQ